MKTIQEFRKRKNGPPLVMLTAYDFPTARMEEEAGVDIILVGDSLGNVFQGRDTTRNVTLDQMAYHVEAVRRGAPETLVVGDLPYRTYENREQAAESARRLADAGADAVKLEGCREGIVSSLTGSGIPVMGHLGLLPQTSRDFKVKGKTEEEAAGLLEDARALEREGIFSLVLECIPEPLGKRVTEGLPVPVIGIGAGRSCDGQVMVINDLLGMTDHPHPRFVRAYGHWQEDTLGAITRFRTDVQGKTYPGEKEIYP